MEKQLETIAVEHEVKNFWSKKLTGQKEEREREREKRQKKV